MRMAAWRRDTKNAHGVKLVAESLVESKNDLFEPNEESSVPAVRRYGKVIALNVGSTKKRMYMYKKLACHAFVFFEVATNPHWDPPERDAISLNEEESEVVSIFTKWLQNRTIAMR